MATLSVQFRDENFASYFDVVVQTSQLNAPMDVADKTLGFCEMGIISISLLGIWRLHLAHLPNYPSCAAQ